jgi:hypothetical protein
MTGHGYTRIVTEGNGYDEPRNCTEYHGRERGMTGYGITRNITEKEWGTKKRIMKWSFYFLIFHSVSFREIPWLVFYSRIVRKFYKADEPTANLDPDNWLLFYLLLSASPITLPSLSATRA